MNSHNSCIAANMFRTHVVGSVILDTDKMVLCVHVCVRLLQEGRKITVVWQSDVPTMISLVAYSIQRQEVQNVLMFLASGSLTCAG